MRIRMMMVVMPMIVPMFMTVAVAVAVAVRMIMFVVMMTGSVIMGMVMMVVGGSAHLFLARTSAELFAQIAFRFGAKPFHMVVVAFLGETYFSFKAKHLFPVFAHLAVHQVGTLQDLLNPVCHGIDDLWVVIEIASLDELYVRIFGRDFIGVGVNPLHQNAGEKEIRKDDNSFVAKFGCVLEARPYQRKSDSGVTGLRPAESHSFPQKTGDLCHVGIGIGIRRTPANDHQ